MNTKQQPTQLIEAERPALPALTPMGMLEKAITSGATVEVMEKLMGLQERWEANQARKAFDNAMADSRAEIPVIIKNQQVGYENKSGGSKTSYMHEDMAQIARTIDPIISKHGLSYRFRTTSEATRVIVTCVVSHRDGHSEENSLSSGHDGSGGKNAIQGLGSALTYLQRYSLKAAFGLAAAADDDGRMAGEISRAPAERSRVPSPSDTRADPEPPQGPHLIKGGKDAASWAELYLEAVLTSDKPPVVFQWIDANKDPLNRLADAAPDEAKRVRVATEKHLAFLRKTDPISSGVPKASGEAQDMFPGDTPMGGAKTAKPAPAARARASKGKPPSFADDYEGWLRWTLDRYAKAEDSDAVEAISADADAHWDDLMPPDKTALSEARSIAEDRLAP